MFHKCYILIPLIIAAFLINLEICSPLVIKDSYTKLYQRYGLYKVGTRYLRIDIIMADEIFQQKSDFF